MAQPFPNPNITGTVELIDYANTVTNGWVSTLLLLGISVVVFMVMKNNNYKTSDSFVLATLLPFVLGALLWAIGLIEGRFITFCLAMFMLALMYSLLDRN